MNSLPSKTALRLIQGIESGMIAPNEAARQIAQIHTAQQENYAQTIISGDTFKVHMLAAQAEHHPNTPIIKLRFVSFFAFYGLFFRILIIFRPRPVGGRHSTAIKHGRA